MKNKQTKNAPDGVTIHTSCDTEFIELPAVDAWELGALLLTLKGPRREIPKAEFAERCERHASNLSRAEESIARHKQCSTIVPNAFSESMGVTGLSPDKMAEVLALLDLMEFEEHQPCGNWISALIFGLLMQVSMAGPAGAIENGPALVLRQFAAGYAEFERSINDADFLLETYPRLFHGKRGVAAQRSKTIQSSIAPGSGPKLVTMKPPVVGQVQ